MSNNSYLGNISTEISGTDTNQYNYYGREPGFYLLSGNGATVDIEFIEVY